MTAGIGRTIGDDHRADREQMAIRDAVPNHAQRAGAGVAGRRLTERAVAHRRATRRGTRPRHDVEGGGDAEHRRGGIDHVDGAADRADVAARVGDLIAQRVATGGVGIDAACDLDLGRQVAGADIGGGGAGVAEGGVALEAHHRVPDQAQKRRLVLDHGDGERAAGRAAGVRGRRRDGGDPGREVAARVGGQRQHRRRRP